MMRQDDRKRPRPRIAVVMPLSDEGSTIAHTVLEIRQEIIRKLPGTKLLIFEYGSRDNTKQVLRDLGKKYRWLEVRMNPENFGYPNSARSAFASIRGADYDYLVFMDADGQHFPSGFADMLSAIETSGVDMVIAQRSSLSRHVHKRVLLKGLSFMERNMFDTGYEDITSSFRIMKAEVGKKIAREVRFSKYNFWLEFAARASLQGVSFGTVDVNYRERSGGGTSKVYSIRNLPNIVSNEFKALIKTRIEHSARHASVYAQYAPK